MTTPTLERAARALADHFGCEWETMRDADRETITGYCRAVLMAVRTPDEAMVKAAEDREEEIVGTYGCADPTGGFETDGPKICFTAMIDEILAEGE